MLLEQAGSELHYPPWTAHKTCIEQGYYRPGRFSAPGTHPQTACTYKSHIRTLLLPFYQLDFHEREHLFRGNSSTVRHASRLAQHAKFAGAFVKAYSSDQEINSAYPCVKWRPDP